MISVTVSVGRVLINFCFSRGKLWNILSAVFAVIKIFKSAAATQLFEKIKYKTRQVDDEW